MSPAPARAEIDLEARREAARKRRFQQVEEERARREAEKNGGDAACVPCVCPDRMRVTLTFARHAQGCRCGPQDAPLL